MSVFSLMEQRHSVRAFRSDPVPDALIKEVFHAAQNSPSNCNVQPWQTYVVSGNSRNELSAKLRAEVSKMEPPNPDFNWNVKYEGEHRQRQFGAADALYGAMNIDRFDKPQRARAMLRNWTFFDAPHAAFFCMQKYLNIMGAVDMGIYAQSLALLFQERGVKCIFQGALGQFPKPVHDYFNMHQDVGVLFGMSFGYEDPEAQVNTARTIKTDLDNSLKLLD